MEPDLLFSGIQCIRIRPPNRPDDTVQTSARVLQQRAADSSPSRSPDFHGALGVPWRCPVNKCGAVGAGLQQLRRHAGKEHGFQEDEAESVVWKCESAECEKLVSRLKEFDSHAKCSKIQKTDSEMMLENEKNEAARKNSREQFTAECPDSDDNETERMSQFEKKTICSKEIVGHGSSQDSLASKRRKVESDSMLERSGPEILDCVESGDISPRVLIDYFLRDKLHHAIGAFDHDMKAYVCQWPFCEFISLSFLEFQSHLQELHLKQAKESWICTYPGCELEAQHLVKNSLSK